MLRLLLLLLLATLLGQVPLHAQSLNAWQSEFPKADFVRHGVPYREFEFDGNTRDSIPPIYAPVFVDVESASQYSDFEPVISISLNGDARAYPLQIMLWHEIVNDVVGGEPVLVSYCPLCNSGVVYRRTLDGQVLTFGNTGRIRRLDMVMFDQQSESWWQQFSGRALMGALQGRVLEPMSSRLESMAEFRARAPNGQVLVPNDPTARPYGTTPFAGMDSRRASKRFSKWPLPAGINPMQYVVVVSNRAWPLSRLRSAGVVRERNLVITWKPRRNSLHDTAEISDGRDLGNVVVQSPDGQDQPYDVVFAFAFAAFIVDGDWMLGP